MAVQELPFSIQPLQQSFRTARRWMWLQWTLRTLAKSVCVSVAFALAASLLALFAAPVAIRSWLWLASAAAPVAGLVAALLSRPTESEAIRKVDLQLELGQRLGTAHELLSTGSDGALVRWQLAQAADLAGEVPMSKAFPLLPRRELVAALLLAVVTGILLVLASLGVAVPNPFSAVKIPGVTQEVAQAPEQPLFTQKTADGAKPSSAALDSTNQLLNEIQRQAQRGALSTQAAAAALQQADSELNRAADQSRVSQEALDNLAANLRDTAAASDIAQSLRQGNYQQAAQQLHDLGQQLDQLSPAARQQLSQALGSSASQSQGAQDLARAESRASQNLQRPDSTYSSQSMDRLSQSVQNAGSQVIPQDQLANTWQQLNSLSQQLANQKNGAGSQAPTSPQLAQGPEGTGQRSTQLQQDQGTGNGQQTVNQPGQGNGSSELPGSGGLAGNTPGGPPLGAPNPRLGPDGKPLDVSGQISGQFSGQPDTGVTPPSVMRQGDASSTGGSGQSGAGASAPAENVFVPSDRRSVVRDYFNGGSASQ